jgi:hypothetical protein
MIMAGSPTARILRHLRTEGRTALGTLTEIAGVDRHATRLIMTDLLHAGRVTRERGRGPRAEWYSLID